MVRSSLNLLRRDSRLIRKGNKSILRNFNNNVENLSQTQICKNEEIIVSKTLKNSKKDVLILGINGTLPCNELTKEGYLTENDDNSVSSLESYESVTNRIRRRKEVRTIRRTLFPKYWETKPAPIKLNRTLSEGTSTTCASSYDSFQEPSSNNHELRQLLPFRRCIFQLNTTSMPTLTSSSSSSRQQYFRKTVSTSALLQGKPCLRTNQNNTRNSAPVVTFNPKVAVHEFQRPHVAYAPHGWSDFFH
mmetsp:Transcript_29277/g.28137  ORF Transcript_29277/g.28137 Transcript_29277/m.28137 type:complete len:247 (-) Transcript_29277:15-755(-)